MSLATQPIQGKKFIEIEIIYYISGGRLEIHASPQSGLLTTEKWLKYRWKFGQIASTILVIVAKTFLLFNIEKLSLQNHVSEIMLLFALVRHVHRPLAFFSNSILGRTVYNLIIGIRSREKHFCHVLRKESWKGFDQMHIWSRF